MTIGTEGGGIVNPYAGYQNDAPITSLLSTDDGLMVAFADSMNRVHLYFSGGGILIWTKPFDGPVQIVDMWTREGPLFSDPTYVLVRYEGGFSLLRGSDGETAWSYVSDEPFVMRSTETGKIIVGSGSRVNFFWLGGAEPYRGVSVEGPVEDILTDANGLTLLLLRPGEAIFYDGITGEVHWRRSIDASTQAALSWDGERSFLLSNGRLVIISKSGQQILSQDVGEGQLLAPSASSYYFMLRHDRIDAYRGGRPAPVWRASVVSPYEVYVTPGGATINTWTSDRLFVLDNTNPSVASRPWLGIFGTVIIVQVLLTSLLLMTNYPLPNLGDLVTSILIGLSVGVISLITGILVGFVSLGLVGAFVAALAATTAAALSGRRAGSTLAGVTIGLVVGVVGFLTASLLIAFYRYAFDILPTFPAVQVTIRSLTLGWLLGMTGGFLGGLSAHLLPRFLRSAFSRT